VNQVELVDQPNIVTVTESVVTVQVAPQGLRGPQGEPGVGAPIYGQVAKMTSGTITITTAGVYQSTGLTAILDGEADGIGVGTTDLFAIKNVSGETRRLQVSASYDGTVSGGAVVLGLALAINGVLDTDTECRATTSAAGAIAKLATAWIIDLPDGQEVAMRVANFSNTNNIAFQRGRIVATSVAGFGPQGAQGVQGPAATIDVGTTSTLAPGAPATVVNSGTTSAAVFDFGVPEGIQGVPGNAATVNVGTTSTLAPGSSATVVNSGTTTAAVFDFGIPEGDKGDKGDAGEWDTAQTTDTKTASYTLLTADAGKLILVNSSSNLDVTVDGSLSLSVGQRIDLARLGTGTVTVVPSGVTVNATPGLKLRARYSTATLLCVGTDDYLLLGDLSA
jgi:hypothetical protein